MPLSQKQNEYIRKANCRWNFKIGAVRSGKTYVDTDYIIPARIRQVHDEPGLNLILGVSRETIERNVLQPMREKYTDRLIGTINGRNVARICGEDVYCLGAEKINQVAKIQGMSVKYCYGDEIAKWNPEVFFMLLSRLDRTYSRFDGACNPEYPGHWLKQFIDREDIDLYLQHYTIFDNPFLPKEFVENLCKEYAGTVYYGRYIQGEWTLAEGLIYPMYQEAIEEPPEDNPTERAVSIDYGTMNAFAAILWEHHGKVWYAVREYYYSGRDTGTQKTDEEYAVDLDRWLSDIKGRLKVYIDPSAASFIAQLRRRVDDNGVKKYAVIPADNDVLDGIRDTATCMRRGTIKISPQMANWLKEVQGYVWDETEGVERPVKIADHLQDAVRYFVRTRHLAQTRREVSGNGYVSGFA